MNIDLILSLHQLKCEYWFRRFKSGDFDLKNTERSGQAKKFQDAELQALLDENSTRTLEELAEALNVSKSIISDSTQWERFKKKTNGFHTNYLNCVQQIGQSKSYNHLHFIAFSTQKKKEAVFFHQIVTDDEKWIYHGCFDDTSLCLCYSLTCVTKWKAPYDNPRHKKVA